VNQSDPNSQRQSSENSAITPRQKNNQNTHADRNTSENLDKLIDNLTRALSELKTAEPESKEIQQENHERIARLKKTGETPLPKESNDDFHHLRKKKKRRKYDEAIPKEFQKYIPGSKRRQFRRKILLISIAIVILVFFVSNYYVAKFFYSSGLSEGMRRGLEAQKAVEEAFQKSSSH